MPPGESQRDPPGSTAASAVPEPSGFDLAYAITYGLLGDESLARSTALTIVHRPAHRSRSGLGADGIAEATGIPDLAADAVAVALLSEPLLSEPLPSEPLSSEPLSSEPLSSGSSKAASAQVLRDSLRRRLAVEDDTTRAAVALHHLAGIDIDRVSQLLRIEPADLAEMCEPFTPPAGVRYSDLGDPAAQAEPVVRPRRVPRRRVPFIPLLALGAAAILILWASSASGPRPTLGAPLRTRVSPIDTAATFDKSADPLPSAGCPAEGATLETSGGDAPGVSGAKVKLGSTDVHYRLSQPSAAGARPLVIAVPAAGQGAEEFQETTDLEASRPEDLLATLDAVAPENQSEAVVAVADALTSHDCVDLRRITVVGYGAGAAAAGRAACSSPGIFAGVAMVAGWAAPEHCQAMPPVSALLAANADDPVMGADGSGLDDATRSWAELARAGTSEVEAVGDDTLINRWSGEDGVRITSVWSEAGGTAWSPADTLAVTAFVGETARVVS